MPAAPLAAYRIAPDVPQGAAVRGPARAAVLSLLVHGAAVLAIAGFALQPEAPQGEAVFAVELVSTATAAAGTPQMAAAEAVDASPSPEVAGPSPEPVPAEQPEQVAQPEPDAVPLPPETVAEADPAPVPVTKPKARPRPPVQAMAQAKPQVPPAAIAAARSHSGIAAVAQQVTPAAMPGSAAQAPGQQGAETQLAAAAAGSSDEPPVITRPRFRAPPRPPDYPPRARAMEQQGVSVVRALVDTDGTSREIRLWRSSGFDALDRAALVAVRGWRFEAARRGEHPVLAWVEIPVRFELR